METPSKNEVAVAWGWVKTGMLYVAAFIVMLMFALPTYMVWQQGMSGKAALEKAEQTRRVLVATATAEKEAAQLRADAIKIMGEAAKEYPEYRQQEFMAAFGEALREGNISQIIYVPTEGNIPVMEASRLQRSIAPAK